MTRYAGADLNLIPEELAAIGASKEFPIDVLLNEGEEIAGLRPLPITRMIRQPARKQRKLWEKEGYYGRSGGKMTKEDVDHILRKTQSTQEAINNWDPVESEWKERLNRENPNPRSRPAPYSNFKEDLHFQYNTEKQLENLANKAERSTGQDFYGDGNHRLIQYLDLLPPAQAAEYRRLKFKQFDNHAEMFSVRKDFDPYQMNADSRSFGIDRDLDNDLLAEWKTRRRFETLDRLDTVGDLIGTIDTPIQESQTLNEIMFPGI